MRVAGWGGPQSGAGSPGDTMGPCPAARRPEQTHALRGCTACPGPGRAGAGPWQSRPCLGLQVHLVCPAGLPPAVACGPGRSLSQDSRGLHRSAVSGGLAIRLTRRPDTEAPQAAEAHLDTQSVRWTAGAGGQIGPGGGVGTGLPALEAAGERPGPPTPQPREVQEARGTELRGLGGWGGGWAGP